MLEKKSAIAGLLATLLVLGVMFGGTGCSKPNSAPVISQLTAEPNPVPLSGSSTITCTAHDEDGDLVIYSWSSSQGTLSGQGPSIMWQAPSKPGSYTVAVTTIDSQGGQTTGQLSVDVVNTNKPPVIEVLKADPSLVCPGDTSTIRCKASDPDGDELTYAWTASGGSITGDGSTAYWTAPSAGGTYTVTVTVTDGGGGETRRGIRVGQSRGSGGGGGGG
ncbi:MAG: PKD domain-containing protein [Chloroflexota bacterium]